MQRRVSPCSSTDLADHHKLRTTKTSEEEARRLTSPPVFVWKTECIMFTLALPVAQIAPPYEKTKGHANNGIQAEVGRAKIFEK